MKYLRPILLVGLLLPILAVAEGPVKMRDPAVEGGASWQWDVFYHPVLVIVGSLAEVSKPRPDFTLQGSYESWANLEGIPSIAANYAKSGAFLLLTQAKIKEVIYCDSTLLRTDAHIDWAKTGRIKELPCILPAQLHEVGDPEKPETLSYNYSLSELVLPSPKPDHDYVLIFRYVSIFPLQGLTLASVADLKDLAEIKAICARRSAQRSEKATK